MINSLNSLNSFVVCGTVQEDPIAPVEPSPGLDWGPSWGRWWEVVVSVACGGGE